jgi:uncharacterized protein
MLIRFSLDNFKSFGNKQQLTMIPAKRYRSKKHHVVDLSKGKISLLRAATIYGANASGKTNLIEAIRFAKYVVTERLPNNSSKLFCRVFGENKSKESKFEFEIFKNNKFYAYGFSLNLAEQQIISEWLYELMPQSNSQQMLFERETEIKRIEISSDIKLSKVDEMRLQTYKIDFEENRKTLFLQEMNRNKKINSDSALSFFRDVYEWFEHDLTTISPDQPITNFEYFYGESENQAINEIIQFFDTGISKVKVEKISISEFKSKVNDVIAEQMINVFKERLAESNEAKSVAISMRSKDTFFNIKGSASEEPVITTIMLEHGSAFDDFEFSEESDGTRRLFDLLDILVSNETNKIYVIDEMERSLHPKLTYKYIELFLELLDKRHTQLIFTTHESTIMDQDLLRRDEIWFVERDNHNISHLYSLDRFKERYDKQLSKAYLEGRYGAVPVFKKFKFREVHPK